MDYAMESLKKHREWKGKIEVICRAPLETRDDLSLAYTPGVAQPCLEIQKDINQSYELTRRSNLVAVVTDGTAPDRSYDIWRDMKMLQVLQRGRFHDLSLLPCGKVLELCTIEPAKALKLDHLIGSLEVGKKADIIAVDVEQPHLAPFGDMPVQRLVYHAMGQDVDLTIVDGAVVMEGRKLTKVDEKKIIADARGAYATMLERLGDPTVTQNPKLYELTQKM